MEHAFSETKSLLASAQCAEVFCCLWRHITAEVHNDATERLCAGNNVEEDSRITRAAAMVIKTLAKQREYIKAEDVQQQCALLMQTFKLQYAERSTNKIKTCKNKRVC